MAISRPSEIKPKSTISILIYGQPSIGKTTLGCSAANAVLFDFDGGVNRIHPAHMIDTVQVESWEQVQEAMNELASPEYANIRTIVIDTFGKMLNCMEAYIMAKFPKFRMGNGGLAVKGYGERKIMFKRFLSELEARRYNVIFIAHDKEDNDGDRTKIRPLVSGTAGAELLQELDLVGYMFANNNRRRLAFNLNDNYLTKNSAHLPDVDVPEVVSADGSSTAANTFIEDVVFAKVREDRQKAADLRNEYNKVMTDSLAAIQAANTCDELNALLDSFKKAPVMHDSSLRQGQALNARARQIGAKYNKAQGKYTPITEASNENV